MLLYNNKLECLPLPFISTLVKYLHARLEPTSVELLTGLDSSGKLLVLPAIIRLGWKKMAVANTLAYETTATITVVKSFVIHAHGVVK